MLHLPRRVDARFAEGSSEEDPQNEEDHADERQGNRLRHDRVCEDSVMVGAVNSWHGRGVEVEPSERAGGGIPGSHGSAETGQEKYGDRLLLA